MKTRRIIVIGKDGMLGSELVRFLEENKYEVFSTMLQDLNICDKTKVTEVLSQIKPDAIINCAAYTNVDGCETNIELAENVNGKAVANLAEVAKQIGAELIQISTDYVFDGTLPIEESYTEEMIPNPISVYGRTKYEGEKNAKIAEKYYILRTAWLYGNGKNFVRTMLNLAKTHNELNVVCDQYGSPTSTKTLCEIIEKILEFRPPYGIYHCTNEGYTTWYEFAKSIFNIANIKVDVVPIKTSEYLTVARRPQNSKLAKEKLHSINIKPKRWEEALKEYLKEELK